MIHIINAVPEVTAPTDEHLGRWRVKGEIADLQTATNLPASTDDAVDVVFVLKGKMVTGRAWYVGLDQGEEGLLATFIGTGPLTELKT